MTRVWAIIAVLSVALPAAGGEPAKRFECLGIGGGGQMYAGGISPHDPKLMHVSCDMGTFYVTGDGGASWGMIDQLQMVGSTGCKPAYHPTDPDTLYMPYGRNALQIRVSRDRGRTWEILCEKAPWGKAKGRDKYETFVTAIDLSPNNPKTMFVSTPAGLYRSADGGKSFARCAGVKGVALGVHISAGRVLAAASTGVYASADGGKVWERIARGLAGELRSFCAATDATTRATCVYVVAGASVYCSADGGKTFTRAELPKTTFRFVAMAETSPRVAYASNFDGKFGVWKTIDGGKTWTQIFGRYHKNIRWGWLGTDYTRSFGGRANRITVAPRDPDYVMVVNTGELFLTQDGGRTWAEGCSRYAGPDPKRIEKGKPWSGIGLEVALPTNMVFDPFVKDRVYLIYGDIGFLISTDGGRSWRRSVAGIPKGWVNRMWELIADPARKGVLYGACSGQHGSVHDTATIRHGGGVVLSTDHGETWKPISKGLPTGKAPCTGLAMDAKSPPTARVLYSVMQNDGVYRSADGGASWARCGVLGRKGNRNVEQVRVAPDGSVYALVIGRSDNWKFRYGGGGLWRSTDGGKSWTEATAGLDLAYPKEFAVDPRNPRRIFLATTQAPSREPAGLWETTDGGKTWTHRLKRDDLGKELYGFVHSGQVTFHPSRKGVIYYSTKTHGLWRTSDDGKTWKRLRGIPRLAVGRVIFDPSDAGIIYVCSVGLWKGPAEGL